MRIEVWSDVVCPWCYIGKRRLEAALAKFAHRESVEIVYRAYELDPEAPKNSSQTMEERLASKYGGGAANARMMMARVTQVAAQDGLQYRLEKTKPENTFDAHRLMAYAATVGKQLELAEVLFKAYFTEGKRLGAREELLNLATSAGLDAEGVAQVLDDQERFAAEVRQDEQRAAALGIRGVPCAVVDGKFGVSGAQPMEAFLEVLEHAWARQPAG